MNKHRRFNLLMLVLSILLVVSTVIPQTTIIHAADHNKDVNEILNNLSDAQRDVLNKLEVKPGFTIHPDINVTSLDPVNVIVEFKQDPAKVELGKNTMKRIKASLAQAKEKVEESHQTFKEGLKKLTIKKFKAKSANISKEDIKITREYRHAINGVAMTLPGTGVKDLLQIDAVERIWKDKEVKIDLPKVEKIEPKMADSIPQIGVDKLHEEGIKGEGINVGVIDTGIDYNHPDLKNAYAGYRATDGEDSSVVDPDSIKGWDYVENDADPMEMTHEEWQDSGEPEFDVNGNSYYTSHGTHVSGTVAGQQENDVDYAVKGVAPAVDLYAYRVLGSYGSGQTSWVLAGIDKAVKDGMDVINLSLGMDVNDPLSPTSVAVNNAMLSDVVAVVAAGNIGPGEQTVGSPGAAAFPITVGASDVSQNIPTFTAISGEDKITDLKLLAKDFTDNLADLQDQTFSLVDAGIGTISDFEGIDVTDKIALVERGDIAFDEKVRNAKDAGAKAAIIYNNEDGQIPFYIGENTAYLPAFRLSKEDGDKLMTGLSDETVFTFGELGNTKSEGDHLADFSSRGPVAQTYDIKPDVVAPGVAIFSTAPFYMNDPEGDNYDIAYARMQGTSMASPHVAGTAALILQENPDYTPFDVKTALMNTAVDLQEDYSVYEVGAGRINAYNAVHSDVSVTVMDKTENIEGDQIVEIPEETGSIRFGNHYFSGKNETIKESRKVAIENRHSEDKSFTSDVEFLEADGNRKNAEENGVELEVSDSIIVSAEQSKEIQPTIHVPANAEIGRYEGYIHITNQQDHSEHYQIPFAIRVTDKGVDYAEFGIPVVTNDTNFNKFLRRFTILSFKLKSPMKTIDLIAKDEKTGEPVGFIGTIDASDIDPDMQQGTILNGSMFPFTGDDSNPISDELVPMPEGQYLVEMISKNAEGKTFTKETFLVIDNTPPKMTYKDFEPGIHEVDASMFSDEEGHHAIWVHTNLYDSTIDLLKSKGFDYDQSANILAYYQDSPWPGTIPVKANGDAKFGITSEEIADGPTTISLMPVDLATAADTSNKDKITFIKEGSPYGVATYNEDKVKLGDEITLTLHLKNVKKLLSGEFEVEYQNDSYAFRNVKVNKAFSAYAKEHGVSVSLSEPSLSKGEFTDSIALEAAIDSEEFEGFSGDIPFLDVTFEVVEDHIYGGTARLSTNAIKEFNYDKYNTDKKITAPVFGHDDYQVISKHSIVQGEINTEAFLHEEGFMLDNDYEEIGVKVYARNSNGKTYEGTIDNYGSYQIKGLPVSEEPYELVVEAPGHLNSVISIKAGKEINGELVGNMVRIIPPLNFAGDITGDGIIDIMDVMRAVAHYGKENNKADINKDGIVDETDIRFIEKNFLKVGPDVKGNKQPKEKLGKKGLNDFLQALGLEPVDE